MNHIYCVVSYYPGLEDGYMERSNFNLHPPKQCNINLIPFIYDEDGHKHAILESDKILICDGVKQIKNKFA